MRKHLTGGVLAMRGPAETSRGLAAIPPRGGAAPASRLQTP